MINEPVHRAFAAPANVDRLWEKITYRPEPFDVPAGLKPLIEIQAQMIGDLDPVLVRADLNGDGIDEYLLLAVSDYVISTSQFFYRDDDGWKTGYLNFRPRPGENKNSPGRDHPDRAGVSKPRYRRHRVATDDQRVNRQRLAT
jgi:hypothetical protein